MRCPAAERYQSCGSDCPLDRFVDRDLFYLEWPGLLDRLLDGFDGPDAEYSPVSPADDGDPAYLYDVAASVGLSESLEPSEAGVQGTEAHAFVMAAIACARRKMERPSDGGAE
ncbi:MAG TPA: hypothetical protein VLE99_03070 [Candidatus Saccharimonadales bacterium]|nr:hypothetical protein [Candidatus Saccharimonadales bacterium]